MQIIEQKKEELRQLCEQHKVDRLYLFGSVLTNKFAPDSDIDFLVLLEPLPPIERGEHLMALWSGLEDLFARKIDLLTEESVKNPFLRRELNKTRRLIYDRQSQKISI